MTITRMGCPLFGSNLNLGLDLVFSAKTSKTCPAVYLGRLFLCCQEVRVCECQPHHVDMLYSGNILWQTSLCSSGNSWWVCGKVSLGHNSHSTLATKNLFTYYELGSSWSVHQWLSVVAFGGRQLGLGRTACSTPPLPHARYTVEPWLGQHTGCSFQHKKKATKGARADFDTAPRMLVLRVPGQPPQLGAFWPSMRLIKAMLSLSNSLAKSCSFIFKTFEASQALSWVERAILANQQECSKNPCWTTAPFEASSSFSERRALSIKHSKTLCLTR